MNSSKLLWLLGISSGLLGLAACASEEEIDEEESTLSAPALKISPPDQISATENFKLWSEYCVGDQEATRKPVPNYENPDVLDAAKSLTRVATHCFALYGSVSQQHCGTRARLHNVLVVCGIEQDATGGVTLAETHGGAHRSATRGRAMLRGMVTGCQIERGR